MSTASGSVIHSRRPAGAPAPFIGFVSGAGVTTTGEVRVTADAGTFTFESADIYSSTTPIPYVITGLANAGTVFTLQGTQPYTFGNFATVRSPNPDAPIDTLLIRLSNPAAACCPNPVRSSDQMTTLSPWRDTRVDQLLSEDPRCRCYLVDEFTGWTRPRRTMLAVP
jgi:hypothetical protein